MEVQKTKLEGVLIIKPRVFGDDRGYFFESWQKKRFAEFGINEDFVQDNVSLSKKGTLRGLHFQSPSAQGKLVSVFSGEVFDVAVDIRKGSETFGEWIGETLSSTNHLQLYIPPGFAHGFFVTSDEAIFSYKVTEYYDSSAEKTIIWNDPEIGVKWPTTSPVLSEKDKKGLLLKDLVGHL